MKTALSLLLALCLLGGIAYAAPDAGPAKDAGAITMDAGARDAGAVTKDAGPTAGLPSPDQPAEFVGAIVDATKGGSWRVLSALLIVALVWATRKWGHKVKWFATTWGGITLALGFGVLTQFIAQLVSDTAIDAKFILNGVVQGVLASGVWHLIKDAAAKKPADPVT